MPRLQRLKHLLFGMANIFVYFIPNVFKIALKYRGKGADSRLYLAVYLGFWSMLMLNNWARY